MSDETNPKPGRKGIKRKPAAAKQMAAELAGVAAAVGAELPDESRMAPRVNVQLPITALCRALAQHLSREPLFLRESGDVVTVDETSGAMEPMTSLRFPSFAEERVTFTKSVREGEAVVSLSAEASAKILASDIFRRSLRPLRTVHSVRLPAWANAERTAVKLLSPGYDEATQSFTVDSVPYDTEMPPDKAREFLLARFAEFPFARPDGQPQQPLAENRSFSVQMAAMLSSFCRPMLTGTLRPAVAVQANQAGSGKTLLLRMALAPVHGSVTVQAAPREESELGKLLTATAAEGHSYLVLDNLSGFYASAELESFLTSPRRRGRLLGLSRTVDAENQLAVFITGNGLHISPDLARRCLLLDLWHPGEVTERQIANPIDEEQVAAPAERAKYLAAMWSLVQYWSNRGAKRSTGARLASFETFSAVVGGICQAAHFADPIARPEVNLDATKEAWLTLLRKLATTLADGETKVYTLDEILDAASDAELTEVLIGDTKSPRVSMGKRLARWKGREFTDGKNRAFRFGHRKAEAGSRYAVEILTPAAAEPAAAACHE